MRRLYVALALSLAVGVTGYPGSPAAAHNNCVPTMALTYTTGVAHASANITCTSGHTYYSVNICFESRPPLGSTWSRVGSCSPRTYSSATARYDWWHNYAVSTCPVFGTSVGDWRATGRFEVRASNTTTHVYNVVSNEQTLFSVCL